MQIFPRLLTRTYTAKPSQQSMLYHLFHKNKPGPAIENGPLAEWAFLRLRILETACFLLETFVFGLSILACEVPYIEIYGMTLRSMLLICVMVVSTLNIPLILFQTFCQFDFLKLKSLVKPNSSILDTNLFTSTGLFLLFCLVYPNYFLDTDDFKFRYIQGEHDIEMYYHANEMLLFLGLLRYLHSFRFARNFSKFNSNSAHRVCRMFNFENNSFYVFRCYFKESPMMLASAIFVFMTFTFSYGIRIFERSNPFYDFDKFFNSVWFTIVTMVTLGYGDILPITLGGRILAAILGIIGMINTYFVTLVMINKVSLLNSESDILERYSKAKMNSDLEKVSLLIMKTILRLNLLKRRKWASRLNLRGQFYLHYLYKYFRKYMELRNEIDSVRLFDEGKTIEGINDLTRAAEWNKRMSQGILKMTKDWDDFIDHNQ